MENKDKTRKINEFNAKTMVGHIVLKLWKQEKIT